MGAEGSGDAILAPVASRLAGTEHVDKLAERMVARSQWRSCVESSSAEDGASDALVVSSYGGVDETRR